MSRFDLPYFDQIIAKLEQEPDSELADAFRRHVHWGCFRAPEHADDSAEAYIVAAEELTRSIAVAARVGDGLRILDVGCGFGGTIHHLDQRLSNAHFVGLNIDGRQLRRARDEVPARAGNTIAFVEGDGCQLPFADNSFDVVLAVECIFHFRSRKAFFKEVARLLAPGGRLALSDFILNPDNVGRLGEWMASNELEESPFYGANSAPMTSQRYTKLAARSHFDVLCDDNITANTLPTYPAMRRLFQEAGLSDGASATDYLEAMAVQGFVEYHILAFEASV